VSAKNGIGSASSKNRLVYAFCIIDNKDAFARESKLAFAGGSPSPRIGVGPPYLVSFQDISAVVSKVPTKDFSQEAIDRNTKDLDWLSRTAVKHEELVEHVLKLTTPIPLKLCTIFKSDNRVLSMLMRNYGTFSSTFKEIRGKVEMGVSAYAVLDVQKLTKNSESSSVKSLQKRVESASKGRAYFLKQELEEMVISEFASKAYASSRRVYEELRAQANRSLINKPVSTQIGAGEKTPRTDMIMNAAFLVSREKLGDFRMRFDQLKREFGSKQFSIKLTGPWPPYNFSQQEF
jgi:hypothetical protein